LDTGYFNTFFIRKGRKEMGLWKLLRSSNTAKPSAVAARPSNQLFDLDQPLFYLSPHDAWTIRDSAAGTIIMGEIGGGKTTGSGATIAKSCLRAGYGALVLCAKPEERKIWENYVKETGRESSLKVIEPNGRYRYNFLDYEMRREGSGGGLTENLVALLSQVSDIVSGKQEQGGGDKFFDRAMQELLRAAIDLLAIARGTVTLEDIRELVASAPQDEEEVDDESWREKSFCARLIMTAFEKEKTPEQEHDFELVGRYWLKEHARLSDRTRTSITATFTSTVDVLQHGLAHRLLGTDTTIVPEATYRDGAVILIDLPIQEFHEVGRVVQNIWKYQFQRAILRRDVERYPRPVLLFADEAQNFVSSFDYQYQAVARSARACTVYLTQNISNFYSVLGARGRDETHAFLGNLTTKIFHAQSDHNTNQYAADLISQQWGTVFNYSTSHGQQSANSSAGGSQNLQYKVLPAEFTTLRKGGPHNQLEVDAIVYQGGRMWNISRDTYMRAVFRQG